MLFAAGYLAVSDVLVTFEDNFAEYEKYAPLPWQLAADAPRIGHIVYNASLVGNQHLTAIRLAKTRNAGAIYITNENLPNPYKSLPVSGPLSYVVCSRRCSVRLCSTTYRFYCPCSGCALRHNALKILSAAPPYHQRHTALIY